MKILQTVKYYEPSKGGMESVVKSIVEGVSLNSPDASFVVYANNHLPTFKKSTSESNQLVSIKEMTPFLLKSQPLSIRYPSLRKLVTDADIIHHHYPFPNLELALLRNIELLKGKRLIITWHANIKNSRWSWIGKYYDPVVKKLLDIAQFIVVTSPQLFEASHLLQGYADKVKVIPLSFNPALSAGTFIPKRFPQGRKFRLLFVGKLRAYKGLNILINAICGLDVELTIIGDGEQGEGLKEQVRSLGITNYVSFLNNVSNEYLVSEYQEADLFILPSINEAEAFGVVQLEAMRNGLPVINTRLNSGVPYVSLHGTTGLTVEPNNSDALREAIFTLMTNKALYEGFSKNSFERSQLFTTDVMSKAYLNLYRS